MKLTKKEFIVWVFLGFCVTTGIILGITNAYIDSKKAYDDKFKELGGCEECGDVLVKCNNGSYEIVKNDENRNKLICGKNFVMPNKINYNNISLSN